MTDITDLDHLIHAALDGIISALEEASQDGILGEHWPERYLRLRSFATSAIHGFAASPAPQTVEAICAAIDKARDSRIDGGFEWSGYRFQSRPSDRENIMGAAKLASLAIAGGAQADDLRWANPDSDFVWITEDNQLVPMDAYAVLSLFQTGTVFKSALTFYARDLKDVVLAAEDPASVDIVNGWPFDPD